MESEQERDAALATADSARAMAAGARIPYAFAKRELAGAEARLKGATTPGSRRLAREEVRAARVTFQSWAEIFRSDSLRAELLTARIAPDTAVARHAKDRAVATAARIAMMSDAAIGRAGGLVYSLLLAVMYLPAALLLLERARELSARVKPTEKERATWRADNGIGFSLSTQWTKALAVLAPWLASFPAAQFLLKVLE